jgi:hypothetical protein
MARQIELWPVERLVPYARNARTHSDDQIAQIAANVARAIADARQEKSSA